MNDYFMNEAIKEAKKAQIAGEIPVGAVIVKNNVIIARGHNTKENTNNPVNHAEIVAITNACEHLKNWRLSDCDIYVTLEPCVMCAGAILNSRIKNLYFGAYDFKYGACGSNDNIFHTNKDMCQTTVYGGIMEEECKKILNDFFEKIR
jgi:tRNA(adenine34) deaminase